MKKHIIMLMVKFRWAYFHMSPNYIKFYMTMDECHFQHRNTGVIHSNLVWVEDKETQ